MSLQFYNTLTRIKEPFKPIKDNHVSMYSCGPTVYHYAHIGNLRAFVFVDLLKRYLIYKKYKVKHVMNITDVDDKTIRNAKENNKSLKEYTEFYTKEFMDDLMALNILTPEIMPKATEHIKEMTEIIEKLKEKGLTYTKEDSTYFSIDKAENYGELANLDKAQLKENADGRLQDADEYGKENPRDFALWKGHEDGDESWDTSIGKGRPGWHIECSAMSTKYLGNTFDIHTGGVDLIFPHHTNEIAQSECATGKKFVNYWLHNAHLIVNGEKMSKSLGNFFTLRDLTKKGYTPIAIRYELLSTHYRQRLDFREDKLDETNSTLERFKELLIKLDNVKEGDDNKEIQKLLNSVKDEFEKNMDDDLNIAGALNSIFVFIREINKLTDNFSKKDAEVIKTTLLSFDSVLGVMDYSEVKIPKEITQLAEERLAAKQNKDWEKADSIRNKIKEKGYSIDDTKDSFILKKL